MTTDKLSKAERLTIGAAVASTVRRAADAPRKVTVVGKDGKPVRETTHVEVAKAVLARSEIEFSVQEGKRPEWVTCKACGRPVKVWKNGLIPRYCPSGAHVCMKCGKPLHVGGSKCGFGKTCRACQGPDRMRRVRKQPTPKHTDEEIRAAVERHGSYSAAAYALRVARSGLARRASALGIKGGDGRSGTRSSEAA